MYTLEHIKAVADLFQKNMLTLAEMVVRAEPQPINITNQTPPAPDVHIDAPVTVQPAEVNVPPTIVNVDAPVVNVPAQEPPQVTVNVPKAEVKVSPVLKADVNMPAEMRITSMPDRVTQRSVKRDDKGAIIETTDVETDA